MRWMSLLLCVGCSSALVDEPERPSCTLEYSDGDPGANPDVLGIERYDEANRLIERELTNPGLSSTERWTFDAIGCGVSQTYEEDNGVDVYREDIRVTCDERGNEIRRELDLSLTNQGPPQFASVVVVTELTYEGDDVVVSEQSTTVDGAPSGSTTDVFMRDDLSRVVEQEHSENGATEWIEATEFGDLFDDAGRFEQRTRDDASGGLIRRTTQRFDDLGRAIELATQTPNGEGVQEIDWVDAPRSEFVEQRFLIDDLLTRRVETAYDGGDPYTMRVSEADGFTNGPFVDGEIDRVYTEVWTCP